MTSDALDVELRAAHRDGNRSALVTLYEQAARRAARAGHDRAAGFFMTQAYVFALETGSRDAGRLRAWLVAQGRETAE